VRYILLLAIAASFAHAAGNGAYGTGSGGGGVSLGADSTSADTGRFLGVRANIYRERSGAEYTQVGVGDTVVANAHVFPDTNRRFDLGKPDRKWRRVYTDSLVYTPPHAGSFFTDSSASIDLTQNVWKQITNASGTLFPNIDTLGFTYLGMDTVAFPSAPGMYAMITNLSFEGGAINDIYEFRYNIGGAQAGPKGRRKTGNTDVGYAGIPPFFYSSSGGEKLYLEVRNTASNSDPTFTDFGIVIWRVGD